jgi:hypothetical protein
MTVNCELRIIFTPIASDGSPSKIHAQKGGRTTVLFDNSRRGSLRVRLGLSYLFPNVWAVLREQKHRR